MKQPLVSIIVPYYQGSVSTKDFQRFINSLKNQSCKDFEVLIFHDGKELRTETINYGNLNYYYKVIVPRINKWGHPLRDLGIRVANGKYLMHTNGDNVVYSHSIKNIKDYFARIDCSDIIIFACKMNGLNFNGKKVYYDNPRDYNKYLILKGIPKSGSIDCMQLITSKKIWDKEGGWFSYKEQGDGIIYELMCKKYSYENTPLIIGEHY